MLNQSFWVALLPIFIRAVLGQTTVTTSIGPISGTEIDFNGNTIVEYLGIPFAEPPVGDRRFARPEPKAPRDDGFTLSATEFGAVCPQYVTEVLSDVDMSEDCLFLNIIVPQDAVDSLGSLPVLLFIPGRGFRLNAGSEYVGWDLAVTGSVIVVTINYRFLTFGYFSTGDDLAPGNYGLWDQRLAIEWVRDNIPAFGGDATNITIVGQGEDGATSVSSQLLSPENNDQLFQRAIIQSGIFDYPSYIMSDDLAETLSGRLAETLNCNQTSWPEKLDCLRGESWQDILYAPIAVADSDYFHPRIDGRFFPEPFDRLVERDEMHQYDIMVGMNSDEGLNLLFNYPDIALAINRDNVEFFVVGTIAGRGTDDETSQILYEGIKQRYVDPVDGIADDDDALRFMIDIYGDGSFVSRSIRLLRYHQRAPSASTYMYFFDYVDDNNQWLTSDARVGKASQGEELFYLWDTVSTRSTAFSAPVGSVSEAIRAEMISYWANFVHTGDPNVGPATSSSAPYWPQYESENETYLWIKEDLTTGQHLRAEYVNVWQDYVPSIESIRQSNPDTCYEEVPVPDILLDDVSDDDTDDYILVDVASSDGAELGRMMGVVQTADGGVGGRRVWAFKGVPYAVPPVGERRFTYSEVLDGWGDETQLNATTPPPACPQTGYPPQDHLTPASYNEDCLFLNIFAPENDSSSTESLPVIVFLHYGIYASGAGVVFDGSTLASYANAVVVTPNYRIGALGFLSTSDDAAPGNYGIMDVITALRWIQKYIGSFGGDPDNVIAYGVGSGASIAHLISLNGLNDGLMHKIISFSDSVLSPITQASSYSDPLQNAKELATALDCPTTTTDDLVSCLKTKSADDIASTPVGPPSFYLPAFFPVWDGSILKDSPRNILESGDFETIPILSGATEMDNTLFTTFYLTEAPCPDEQIANGIINDVVQTFYGGRSEFASLIKMFYLDSELSPSFAYTDCKIGHQASEILSDLLLNLPIMEAAGLLAQADKDVYLSFFSYRPDNRFYQSLGTLPSWVELMFGDDIPYAFGWPFDKQVAEASGVYYDSLDRVVSTNYMEMISSFARTGVPSADPTGTTSWQLYDPASSNALSLNECPSEQTIPRAAEKMTLVSSVIPGLENALLVDDPEPTPTTTPEPCIVSSFIGLRVTAERAGNLLGGLIIAVAVLAGIIVLAFLMKSLLAINDNSTTNKVV